MNAFMHARNRRIGVLAIALSLAGNVTFARGQDRSTANSFVSGNLPKLAGDWSFIHDDKGKIEAKDTAFSIFPAPGTNLFLAPDGGFNVVNAPMALFAPQGDFTLIAKVSAKLADVYDVGALVVWEDDQHWAKLCFENSAKREATVVTVVTRERSDDANSEPVAAPFAYLAIARKGNEFSMHFSRDGVQWRLARHFQLLVSDKLRIGFTAHTFNDHHFAASFSEVVYRATAPKDMRQLDVADVAGQ